ncbi:unnamed protein product [Phytomonas sp. Hart1]|nr:unnamed protein product [Phytomonas sp. Hart1]|eukprot:CCW67264.1 unnamed protein product [Phytomonas sp. isolate Hart1]
MESIVIVDAGRHSVKYLSTSKRNRRKEGDKCIFNDISPTMTQAVDVSLADWNEVLPKVLSREVDPADDLTLFILTQPLFSRRDRELLFTTCFEYLGAKKVCLGYAPVAAHFAAGEVSGVNVDIGFSAVRITPIYQGIPCTAISEVYPTIGAAHVDEELARYYTVGPLPQELTALKSQVCWIGRHDCENDEKWDNESGFSRFVDEITLPDGSCARVPFGPHDALQAGRRLLYNSTVSLPDSFQSIYQSFSIEFHNCPYWSLFGGASDMFGVNDTLTRALSGSLPLTDPIQLRLRNSCNAPVEGASIVSQLNTFKSMCVGVESYEEDGPERCVHSKILDSR